MGQLRIRKYSSPYTDSDKTLQFWLKWEKIHIVKLIANKNVYAVTTISYI